MAFTYTKLVSAVQSFASSATLDLSAATSLYTNPAATITYLSEIEIHNTNPSTITVVMYLPPISVTAALSSEIIRVNILGYDTIWIEPKYPYILDTVNEKVYGVASVSGVNLQLRGSKSA